MEPRKTVQVEVSNILSLVHCAEDYGHGNGVFMEAMANFLGYACSDAEIEAYAAGYLTPESRVTGYSEEDYESAKERLTEWRDRYCKKAAAGK